MGKMKNKFVVYTALFGDYDDLIDPKENYEGCDFICFTDQKHLKSDIWEIRLIEECDLPPNMMNRKYKILPHLFLSEYDWSLYVDANIVILNNPFELAKNYLSNKIFLLPKHPSRDCIYEEARACLKFNKTKYKETNLQIKKYKSEKFPKRFGLGENNIIFRRHNELALKKLMIEWWNELNNYTKRDQLSLGYILWKNDFYFNYIKESSRIKNDYFDFIFHKEELTRTFLDKFKIKLKYYYYSVVSLFLWI